MAPSRAFRAWRFGELPASAFARRATAAAVAAVSSSVPTSPALNAGMMRQWKYKAHVQTLEEFERTAVPLGEAPGRLRSVLDEFGYAVVTGVISSEQELHEFEEDWKRDLIDLIDADAMRDAPEAVRSAYQRFRDEGPIAFPLETVTKYLTQAAGFVLERCLAHGRFAWRARRHPNVHAAFRNLFSGEGDQLVTSLDVTLFSPGGQQSANKNDFSAHVDQNMHDVRPGLADRATYQGILYVWPADPGGNSSTTVIWPGSHTHVWSEMMQDPIFYQSGQMGLHYSEIKEISNVSERLRLAAGWTEHARRLAVPPGGLLLWNSRVMHSGWTGGPRLAQTVCLEPASRRPAAERASKLRLAALGLPACHWASAGMQHDMSLRSPGCFAPAGVRFREGAGSIPRGADSVVLPLRPALRPVAQAHAADLLRLQELVDVDYQLVGMWDCPDKDLDLLEDSVADDFKMYL